MRRFILSVALTGLSLVVPGPSARADVKLHGLFQDNMVLQRDIKVPIWGTADKGEKVTLRFNDQEYTATTENDGTWRLELPKLKEGGPLPMTIIGKNVIQFKNVMVGDVWLVAGGCNMEVPLASTEDAQKNISISANNDIRLFQVPHLATLYPQKNVSGAWKPCGPLSSGVFSAVGYYFGQDLQNAVKIPLGLIQVTHNGTGWTSAGTPAEAWTARHMLSAYPEIKPLIDKFDADVDHYFNVSVPAHITAIEEYTAKLKKAKAERAEYLPGQPGAPFNPGHYPHNPTTLYNGMVAPLIPFAIKGVIWYQGETNAGNAHLYRTLFPALIKNWRDDWDQEQPAREFPFLFVQLGATGLTDAVPKQSHWAELREAQLMTLNRQTTIRVANTAMAVATDCGEPNNFLFRRKQPVGHRLALAARAMVYGQKAPLSGPIFDRLDIEGDKITISFKHLGEGLEPPKEKEELKGFSMAGDDGTFHNAKAVIKDDKIIVTCSKVPMPRAVRFGWSDHPDVNLWNKDGLPASPFRTDNFPVLSTPK